MLHGGELPGDSIQGYLSGSLLHYNERFFGPGTFRVSTEEIQRVGQRVDALATTERIGKSLASGDDLQIVFCALDQNLCVGRLPALSMGHYITLQKQGNAYYRRLRFGQFVGIPSAFQAYYPELRHEHEMAFRNQRTVIFLLGLVRLFLTLPRRGRLHFNMELGRKLALYCSFAKATRQRPPPAVRFVLKLAGLTHA